MSTTLKPGDRVRATVEATITDVNRQGEPRIDTSAGPGWRARTDENWSFEILSRIPEVGDLTPRDDVNTYEWRDGAVIRTTKPNAPIHRVYGQWWFGQRCVLIQNFDADAEFEVLAVGA